VDLRRRGARDLVASKNFGVGDDDHAGGVAQEPAAQSADLQMRFPGTFGLGFTLLKTLFDPDLLEPLAFAIVVAEHLDAVVLTQPTMNLGEELTSLGLGDLGFGQGVGDGTERLQTVQHQRLARILGLGAWRF
jgi:hypothetical protein